jgi:membrane protease YdiL (CAAX protease family)
MENETKPSKRTSPWTFFAMVYAWSWFFWLPAGFFGLKFNEPPVPILIALGGIGPMVVAIALTYTTQDREGRRDYWKRLFDFRRISFRWYAVILLAVPAITGLAVLLDILMGGQGAHLEARFQSNLASILPFVVFTVFFGPLPEELGWRGYALDRLQEKHSTLASSLLLGTAWALWHLPLFFIAGTYQNGLGLGSLAFWFYAGVMIPQSILMTWIYNHTQRSTLSAVLFHFMINFVGELFALSARADLYQVAVWTTAAVAVLCGSGLDLPLAFRDHQVPI